MSGVIRRLNSRGNVHAFKNGSFFAFSAISVNTFTPFYTELFIIYHVSFIHHHSFIYLQHNHLETQKSSPEQSPYAFPESSPYHETCWTLPASQSSLYSNDGKAGKPSPLAASRYWPQCTCSSRRRTYRPDRQ